MRPRLLPALAVLTATGLALSACSASTEGGSTADGIIVGTTDSVTALDPAGSWDRGSSTLQNQVFSWLLTSEPGSTDPVPDLAASAEFTSPTEYTVVLREGVTFANGNALTASDVKFSFDRQLAIADENGPSSLLSDLVSTTTSGDDTVVFTLASTDNKLWPQLLTSPAAAIVDEDVFSAEKLTSDDDIVAGEAFEGQYSISSYTKNTLVQLTKNADYDGLLGAAKNDAVVVKYYADESNLKLDLQEGEIQVAYRTLNATDTDDLRGDDSVEVHTGPGAEMRFFAFNLETMPFGSATAEADEAKALAVRTAVADLIDREEIASQVYKDTYSPLYTIVPEGVTGSTPAYEALYGDTQGGASLDAATAALAAAGVSTPIELKLQYNTDHYGASTSDEYALIKNQLEESGLFSVDLQSTEWTQYVQQFSTTYPAYQLGWFADYPDADNYLHLLEGTDESPSVLGAAANDPAFNALVLQERALDPGAERDAVLAQAQQLAAERLVTVPLLQGTETAIASTSVQGVDDTLDGSGRFRFGLLSIG
ncbi:peptide ABC transporter substrate-binding protein [Microbacteriaceae bacterium VKM Ac-2855]|nr:peptide ABC transporter substrate-binding protein [Microbacteriaceae bacterium VKM Ac-2855]